MGTALIIGTVALFIFSIIYFFKVLEKFIDSPKEINLSKDKIIRIIVSEIVSILSLVFFVLANAFDNNWKLQFSHYLTTILGSVLFVGSGLTICFGFTLYYYKKNLDPKFKKLCRILTFVPIALCLIGVVVLLDGISDLLTFPLYNGFSIPGGFYRSNQGRSGLSIQFYGILMVGGAGIVYAVCDHKFYQKYGAHGILSTALFICFPAGVIGARLWYCFILEPNYFMANPEMILQIWKGGLAIQGGALAGIIAGITYMLIFRKYVNIRYAMDVIIPAILIAQALGRFGNFFNNEVHGNLVPAENFWFLPKFIVKNLEYSSEGGWAPEGQIYLPLCIIETITNLIGYFVITQLIGRLFKKYLVGGDKAMCYLIWYGFTRVFLEKLRFGAFEYNASWLTGFAFVGVGIIGIIWFHIYQKFILKKEWNEN